MKKINKYIDATKENRLFIASAFDVTERMVMMSLEFKRNSALAKKIRTLALQRGGVTMSCLPEMETIHDADGYMRQRFPNGALIECNKETSVVELFKNGRFVARYSDVTIDQLAAIQGKAMAL